MKWLVSLSAVLSLLLGVALGAALGPATPVRADEPPACFGNMGVTIETLSPTASAGLPLTLRVVGVSSDACTPQYAGYAISGNTIVVSAYEPSCSGACAEIVTPWSMDVTLTPLSPGQYIVQFSAECLGDKSTCASAPLTVLAANTTTVTPIPSDTAIPTETATPTATATATPTATPTSTPTVTVTPTVTPTAIPTRCEAASAGDLCYGWISIRAYISRNCSSTFTSSTLPLPNTRLTVHLPDGSTQQVVTDDRGEAYVGGINLPTGTTVTVTADSPPPPEWVSAIGATLAPCSGVTARQLNRSNFGVFGGAFVDFRYSLVPMITAPN